MSNSMDLIDRMERALAVLQRCVANGYTEQQADIIGGHNSQEAQVYLWSVDGDGEARMVADGAVYGDWYGSAPQRHLTVEIDGIEVVAIVGQS